MSAWRAAQARPLLAAQCLLDVFEGFGAQRGAVFAELFGLPKLEEAKEDERFEPSASAERKAIEEGERELRRQVGALMIAEHFWNVRVAAEKVAGIKMQIQVIPHG